MIYFNFYNSLKLTPNKQTKTICPHMIKKKNQNFPREIRTNYYREGLGRLVTFSRESFPQNISKTLFGYVYQGLKL